MHAEERRLQEDACQRRTDDIREQEAREHQARGAGALASREPAREEYRVDDGIKACLRCTQEEPAEVEMELRRHKGHRHANEAPSEHDAGNPLGRREFRRDERAGNLENQIADEENAGAGAKDLRRDPRQILRHRELGIGHIDAVDAGNDGDQKYRQDDAQVTPALETGEIDVFHDNTS